MQIVISPAKKLDLNDNKLKHNFKIVEFQQKSQQLISILQKFTSEDLQKLMNISKNVADLNVKRYQEFSNSPNSDNSYPAILMFAGEVYNGLQAETMQQVNLEYAEQHLVILSGLYGAIKALDFIQPYRLEMGTKLKNNKGDDLYSFWQDEVTKFIHDRLKADDNILVNLASNEYFKVINKKSLDCQIVTPLFKERKNGELKTIMVYAKKARGLMARYIIDNKIKDISKLKNFNIENYRFSEINSAQKKNEQILTFIR